ncbi:MAG: superoxide dismutase [Calditrichaeota bacterium]|nr:MAG: superoxide dismutase [Calditrichota bacterium]
MNLKKSLFSFVLISAFAISQAFAHCQIPCGIYDDEVRISLMREHVKTIEKGMNQILELSAKDAKNYNQIVRWVSNKDEHADELEKIVTEYFLAQRIKPSDSSKKEAHAKYLEKITMLHEMIVYSMKAKQTTDLANVKKLNSLIDSFEKAYFEGHKH